MCLLVGKIFKYNFHFSYIYVSHCTIYRIIYSHRSLNGIFICKNFWWEFSLYIGTQSTRTNKSSWKFTLLLYVEVTMADTQTLFFAQTTKFRENCSIGKCIEFFFRNKKSDQYRGVFANFQTGVVQMYCVWSLWFFFPYFVQSGSGVVRRPLSGVLNLTAGCTLFDGSYSWWNNKTVYRIQHIVNCCTLYIYSRNERIE